MATRSKSALMLRDRIILRVEPVNSKTRLVNNATTSKKPATKVTKKQVKHVSKKQQLSWENIPPPILANVFSNLKSMEQRQVACGVSKSWQQIGHWSPQLWRKFEFYSQNWQVKAFKRQNVYLKKFGRYITGAWICIHFDYTSLSALKGKIFDLNSTAPHGPRPFRV